MSKLTRAEVLAALIEELPLKAKSILTLTDVWHVVPRNTDKPGALPKAYDGLKKALASRGNPCPVKALGRCLARWWARLHGNVLSSRDIDRLFESIPDTELRAVLARFAVEYLKQSRGAYDAHPIP